MKFDSLENIKITSSGSKDNLGRSGKGLIISMGLKSKVKLHKYKKARYSIGNVSIKDLSKIIREFEKLPYKSYEKKSPKYELIYSYFYLARQLVKFMMISDYFNSHNYPVGTEMTNTKNIPTSHVCSTDESELKEFSVDKTLSQICSMD